MSMYDEEFASVYPIKVRYKRTFKSGALAGITVDQSLSFTDEDTARRWIEGATKNFPNEIHSAVIVKRGEE